MADQHQHITPELIRQYLEGKLDDKAMHVLEKQALNDPFLAEALEGYAQHPADQQAALSALQSRLEERVQPKTKRMDYRWLAAASVLLLVCVTAVIMIRQSGSEEMNVAQVRHMEAQDTAKEQPPSEQMDVAKQANEQPAAQLDVASRPAKKSAGDLNAGGQSDELRAEESANKAEVQAIAAAPPAPAAAAQKAADTSAVLSNGYFNITPGLKIEPPTVSSGRVSGADTAQRIAYAKVAARNTGRIVLTNSEPTPIGGYEAFQAYLAENKIASVEEDSVILTFAVMPDSTLRNFRVLQSPCDTCGKAAIRIVTEGPKWAPAPAKKKVRLSVPVGKK